MSKLDSHLKRLNMLLPLDESRVDEYEREVEKIQALRDPASIRPILLQLEDMSPFTGTMETILKAAEAFPRDVFLREFMNVLPEMRKHSPMWCDIEIQKLLNTRDYLVALAPAAKAAGDAVVVELARALRAIEQEDQYFAPLCKEVSQDLEAS